MENSEIVWLGVAWLGYDQGHAFIITPEGTPEDVELRLEDRAKEKRARSIVRLGRKRRAI